MSGEVSDAVRLARLVRPFPTGRLPTVLYHVMATSGTIHGRLSELQINPPRLPDRWEFELHQLDVLLWSLAGYCDDARPLVAEMMRSANGDFQRGLDAVLAMMRGLEAGAVAAPADIAA